MCAYNYGAHLAARAGTWPNTAVSTTPALHVIAAAAAASIGMLMVLVVISIMAFLFAAADSVLHL
jgi:hypothetical protein